MCNAWGERTVGGCTGTQTADPGGQSAVGAQRWLTNQVSPPKWVLMGGGS